MINFLSYFYDKLLGYWNIISEGFDRMSLAYDNDYYSEDKEYECKSLISIEKVIVSTEKDKIKLIETLEYLHNEFCDSYSEIAINFMCINLKPEQIEVKADYSEVHQF